MLPCLEVEVLSENRNFFEVITTGLLRISQYSCSNWPLGLTTIVSNKFLSYGLFFLRLHDSFLKQFAKHYFLDLYVQLTLGTSLV